MITLQGSAADIGFLNASRWLPYLLLGLVVGALVDRLRRKPQGSLWSPSPSPPHPPDTPGTEIQPATGDGSRRF